MVGVGVVVLQWIVWRDAARVDDGWLIFIGYAIVVAASLAIWTDFWPPALLFAAAYRWRYRSI